MIEQLHQVASIIASARNLVAFTGSGISAESGIPTFRDPGGLWDRYDPDKLGSDGVATLGKITEEGRAFFREMVDTLERARPNPGHLALAELERMGILSSVITQNIDNLHWEAGNTTVIEVHGNLYRLRCLTCGRTFKLKKGEDLPAMVQRLAEINEQDSLELAQLMPKCRCGGMTRFDVVHFGEPVQDFPQAEHAAQTCGVMLAVGTSGVVTPAALLPGYAKGAGAKVIEINATGSYFPQIADFSIVEKAGEALPRIVAAVREILG
ncbi:MAG: NAD-dependent protein deacylase [Dehalococcoidia bacterium]|nr:MAG: NAD-dependent protein deacylase [Dehalococcoidia bacterium]